MVIDLAQARAWRRLRTDLTGLAGRISTLRVGAGAPHMLAAELQGIAADLARVLEGGPLAAPARRRVLTIKVRILLLADAGSEDGPASRLALALLELAGRVLALLPDPADAAAA